VVECSSGRTSKHNKGYKLGRWVAVALLVLSAPALAAFSSTTLLYQTPTADVLPSGALAISAGLTFPLTKTSMNVGYLEADANVRYSPYQHLDFALTAYTFADYVLDVKYQIVGGAPDRFGLAVGMYDIGLSSYVSPIGHGTANAWPDWTYMDRTTERFSPFAVTSIPVTRFARLHLGLGRGRFVGYASHSKYFNSDIFFDDYHQWAVALFGGVEVYVTPQVALVAEAGSRDFNTGVKVNYGAFTATVAWTKMEGLIFAKGEPDGCPKFGRLEVGLTYQFNNLSGLSEVTRPGGRIVPPMEPVPPSLGPVVVPTRPAPSEPRFRLLPIYFDIDKSDIRPWCAEILKRNAEAILARAKAGLKADVIIEGHCCPLASEVYNVGLGMRRAEAAKAYLVGLGVDATLLTAATFGNANPQYRDKAEYYLDRKCEFKWRD
jgi:outer membrane protein OmpA-like peptidoglycan-associated protein